MPTDSTKPTDPHPADVEPNTPRSAAIPPELLVPPSERSAAILRELAQLRTSLQALSVEIKKSIEARREADDARFQKQQADIDAIRNEYRRIETRVHVLEEELRELREEHRAAKVAREEERAAQQGILDGFKQYADKLTASSEKALQKLEERETADAIRNGAAMRTEQTLSVIVEDLGYELDDEGVPKRPANNKPTKLTRAAETNTGVRAAIVLLMLQIIWAAIQVVTGGEFTTPASRQPPTFERAP